MLEYDEGLLDSKLQHPWHKAIQAIPSMTSLGGFYGIGRLPLMDAPVAYPRLFIFTTGLDAKRRWIYGVLSPIIPAVN